MVEFLDPALLAALDGLHGRRFLGDVWRVTWPTRSPLAGNSGGGRWSPEGRFSVLYTSLEANGALAEAYHHLSRAPVMSSSHLLLNELSVSLDNVLAPSVDQLVALGVKYPRASRPKSNMAQSIGEAAFMLDYHGLIVPSARWDCSNLMVFLDHGSFDRNKQLSLEHASDVNWPAWREQTSQGQRSSLGRERT